LTSDPHLGQALIRLFPSELTRRTLVRECFDWFGSSRLEFGSGMIESQP